MGSRVPKRPMPRARSWPKSRWVEQQASLFGRMMERVRADPGATAREGFEGGFAAACRRCLACPNATDCHRWLESGGADAPPAFCANAAFLNHVRASGAA
ncbi:DUF6455 family protein [Microvirga sp. ACRRW]|uniref:DUF6455 family protein n=1 Tax=Microvirga sp. ACRRW TaxID=2918205 RepID=UPI001EF3EC5C|nr:DUF6455 family protein [Microvirga sp. ACRRW]MCG7393204.1 DUF6455 family protein [Microvirga sp. ACRRW]